MLTTLCFTLTSSDPCTVIIQYFFICAKARSFMDLWRLQQAGFQDAFKILVPPVAQILISRLCYCEGSFTNITRSHSISLMFGIQQDSSLSHLNSFNVETFLTCLRGGRYKIFSPEKDSIPHVCLGNRETLTAMTIVSH